MLRHFIGVHRLTLWVYMSCRHYCFGGGNYLDNLFHFFVGCHPDQRRHGLMILVKPVKLSPHMYIDMSFELIYLGI